MFSRRFFYVAFCYTILNAWPAGVKAEDPVSVPLPHSDCTRTTNGTIVECIRSDNYTIPGNFDVTLFPKDVTTIMVGKVSVHPTGRKTNTIHNDAPPLPADLNALRTVSLFHFQGTNGTRVPFEAFLVNVKDRLTALHFKYCRIGTLGANFLNGFIQLRILDLNDNDISQIHLDAFEGLPSLPQSGPVLLDTLQLAQNQITALDWTVFAPVANSLTQLALESQKVPKLSTLTLSEPYQFTQLLVVDLSGNSLNFLSRPILDTVPITNDSVIILYENAFCPTDTSRTCACCAAKDFVSWAHELTNLTEAERPQVMIFSCGTTGTAEYWSVESTGEDLPPLEQYTCCSNPAAQDCITTPPTPRTTVRTTARTTLRTTLRTTSAPTKPTEEDDDTTKPFKPEGPGGAAVTDHCTSGFMLSVFLAALLLLHW